MDRVGARRLILAGGVIAGLGLIGLSQTRNLFMFYAFFLIISMGTSAVGHSISWPIIVARWFRRRVGLAMGLATTGPVIGVPFSLDQAPTTYYSSAPELGEHTELVLEELGYDWDAIAGLKQAGAIL